MKRLSRVFSALIAALLSAWYFSPQVYRILHLPDSIDANTSLYAPALAARSADARLVRESGDARLLNEANTSVTISLFGLLPLKTVTVSSHTRTVNVGGEAVGVILKTRGVQVVGFERIETEDGSVCPAISGGLKEGDMICAVNGEEVRGSDHFAMLCENVNGTCVFSCQRDGETIEVTVTPVRDRYGTARIGAWVREGTSGIGTLSFYDPNTLAFAALGHGVNDVDTQKLISPATGFLSDASILRIRKGDGNTAGELIGQFSIREQDAVALVERNTGFGICGTLTSFVDRVMRSVEIAPANAAHRGDAMILSMVDDEIRAYAVRVIRVDVQSSPGTRGMMIEITDPTLLEKTGGIVQGMSGSPLLQDGRLIGVVTHVFLNQPTRGYCIYAEQMANELLPTA